MVYCIPLFERFWCSRFEVLLNLFSQLLVLIQFRPQYTVFPDDPKGFSLDEQYFIGNSGLLVKPVTAPGVTETKIYLAEAQVRTVHNYKRTSY